MNFLSTKRPESRAQDNFLRPASRGPESVREMHAFRPAQQLLGNQGMQRFLRGGVLQRKLTINQPGDTFEQEADRVADSVMRMAGPATTQQPVGEVGQAAQLQRCSCGTSAGGQCEECKTEAVKLQRSSASSSDTATAPPIVHDVLNSPGRSLDAATRNFMEPRFGHDFSDVRVHTDARAAESAHAVNARAYTVGNHIAFGTAQYSGNDEGHRLLAHELSHVIQQRHAPAGNKLQRACGKDEIEKVTPDDCSLVGPVTGGNRFKFNVNCDTFAPGEEARLRKFLNGISSTSELNVSGMASSDGDVVLNEELACARVHAAFQIIKDEHLEHSVKLMGSSGPVPGTSGNPEFRAVTITEKKGGPDVPSSEPELKNVDLTVLPTPPKVITKEPDKPELKGIAIQVTLDDFVAALGSADVVGGGDCSKFTLGFFQICRPFDTNRVIWHESKLNTDFDDDRSDQLRSQMPALDVNNAGDIWTESSVANCADPGVLRHTDVLFTDKPSTGFLLQPTANMFIKGMAWHDFFFTAFSVQRPDGSIHHLKSFYWSIHYCESFDAPTGSDLIGKSTMKKSDVKLGSVIDGAPSEPGLNLAGTPAKITCNDIAKKGTKANMNHGDFDITGNC